MSDQTKLGGISATSLLALCLLSSLGCAGVPLSKSAAALAKAEGKNANLVRSYEARRNHAQLAAAITRWEDDDLDGCEAHLVLLLKREPDNVDARRLLADLQLERGELRAAEASLREILVQHPRDAQTHHSLGLLLEAANRPDLAQSEFQLAQQIEPRNPLFALTADGK